jgi:hypothetical protein
MLTTIFNTKLAHWGIVKLMSVKFNRTRFIWCALLAYVKMYTLISIFSLSSQTCTEHIDVIAETCMMAQEMHFDGRVCFFRFTVLGVNIWGYSLNTLDTSKN